MAYILISALTIRVLTDILFKVSVHRMDQGTRFFNGLLTSPLFWLAIAMSGINFWCWMAVLSHYDLSFAYPLFGICYALIMLSGALFFGESLDRWKLLGIGCILASSLVLVLG